MAEKKFEVELTKGAEDDLESIVLYVAENRSADEAGILLDELESRIETLETLPWRGAFPKELEAMGIREFRQILLGPYRIIYRVFGARVFITVIADGRRNMQAELERRLLRG